jgi:NAD(P)-dependent dehydrogenase (short-subunit alcohol dehydrogenase family)
VDSSIHDCVELLIEQANFSRKRLHRARKILLNEIDDTEDGMTTNAVYGVSTDAFVGAAVWVTGAARGQGARHVERFAAAGARVGAIDSDQAGLEDLAARVRAAGGAVETAHADVTDWEAMVEATERFRRSFGDVSVVVANAGIVGEIASIESVDVAAWRRIVDVNLTGAFHTVKAAISQLRRSPGGAIVLVASAASYFAYPRYAAYCASKAGMLGLLRTAANELGSDGIRVNAICPGWVDTPMLDTEAQAAGIPREQAVSGWVQEQIFQRLIDPDEISDAVLWLASDSARMITGAALSIDGGQVVLTPSRSGRGSSSAGAAG